MKTDSQILKTSQSVNSQNPIEFTKLQGFDVLDKVPEEKLISTYNEEFYSSLSNMKFLSVTIPDENKLFYHFEQNENAPASVTTGQILKTYQDLFIENEKVKKMFRNIRYDVQRLNKEYANIDTTITNDIEPEIKKMEKEWQIFLVGQKTENFRLIKEIGRWDKEKWEIQKGIEWCLSRWEKLEQEVGFKKKKKARDDEIASNVNVQQKQGCPSVKQSEWNPYGDGKDNSDMSNWFNVNTMNENNIF